MVDCLLKLCLLQDCAAALTDVGMETSDAEYLTALFRYTREGDPATVTGTFEELTGRKPRTLQQYAEDHADVLR